MLGNYTQPVDRIEAKLTTVVEGQGVSTDWTLVQEHPKAGYFSGRIAAAGGWYTMEVRAIKDNAVIQTITLSRVGVGEVFVALGQSNAEGLPDSGAFGATDDRVNAIDFKNNDILDPLPENLNFVHLNAEVNIAPAGSTAWCYGELGDRLARKLNVPIMFFNAGQLLVSVINWRESAERLPTYIFDGTYLLPKGLPYTNLRNTLHYYCSLLGVRSLLWIQGETDNYPNKLSAEAYSSNFQRFIDIVRSEFNNDLSWVVARTSLTYLNPSNPEIIKGQNIVIERAGNNIFPGPFTDDLQNPRPDFVHFKNVPPDNNGLSILAENWDKYLDDNFFRNSRPILAKPIVDISVSCNPNNETVITLPDNLANYHWSNGGTTNQIIVPKGMYSASVTDKLGNKLLAPTINTSFTYPAAKPEIIHDSGVDLCANQPNGIVLKATGAELNSFQWSTGATTATITVSTKGRYAVRGYNQFGCASVVSDSVTVKVNPAPEKPAITVLPEFSVCEGKSITLSTNSHENIRWNNDSTSHSIQVQKVGQYYFKVKAINVFGCSEESDSVHISINPLPAKPQLVFAPDSIACQGTTVKVSTNSTESLVWSNNSTAREISVDAIGESPVKVKATTVFGCTRESDTKKVLIKEAPKTPDIGQIGVYTLQALNVSLADQEQFEWLRENSRFATTHEYTLKVEQDGNYQVRTLRDYTINNTRVLSCASASSKVVSLKTLSGGVSLYPNPASDFVYLETKTTLKNIEVKFYSYSGKLMYNFRFTDTAERKEIDLKSLEKGNYLIKIKSDTSEDIRRLIITNK